MWRILLFIFFIILFRRFSKTLEEQQQQQKEPQQDKLNELFQSWGIPLPEKAPVVKPEAKAPGKLSVKKKRIIAPETEIVELKQEIQPQFISEEPGEEILYLEEDKIEEGIILSEILGPPKAHQTRRGGGTGRRAGLKNR